WSRRGWHCRRIWRSDGDAEPIKLCENAVNELASESNADEQADDSHCRDARILLQDPLHKIDDLHRGRPERRRAREAPKKASPCLSVYLGALECPPSSRQTPQRTRVQSAKGFASHDAITTRTYFNVFTSARSIRSSSTG